MPRLQTYSLINNQLTGPVPDFHSLPELELLYLNGNQLSGSVPDLSSLPSLGEIRLDNNQLSGSIPNFHSLPSLGIIDLSYNQLSGSIPNFSSLSSLQHIALENNQLSGSIPDFQNLNSLTTLTLSHNQLSGSIPDLSTFTSLRGLHLNDNQLTGSIPDLSTLINLAGINLHNNQLSGSIPDLSNSTNLTELVLKNNQLSGNVPASVCLAWVELNLDFNKLNVNTADSCIDTAAPNWKETQTAPPTNLSATGISAANVHLFWDPIAYTQHGGYYGVWGKVEGGANYTLMATTPDKSSSSVVVSGLQPQTAYEFVVRTFTPAHDGQQNNLTSVDSEMVTAVTTEFFTLYLPIITSPSTFETVTINSSSITERPVRSVGEVFYSTTVNIGSTLPTGGTFYLSSNPTTPVAGEVDDEVAIYLNGAELFKFTYGNQALVAVPRSIMAQIAGKEVTVEFRDVYGINVKSTPLYLIWSP